MKKIFILVISAAVACANATRTRAQELSPPPAPPAPAVSPDTGLPAPVAIVRDAQRLTENAVHKVQSDVEKQMGQIQQRLADIREHARVVIRRVGGGSGKSLVVRSSDMAPREQGYLEEDLTVMSHILDKAMNEKFADDQPTRVAMGINVAYAPDEVPTRSLYLDGYGALFFLRVNFPLLAPSEKNVEKEKAPTDSAWEEARQEVYGQPTTKSVDPARGYDAEKVSALQKALLDSLRNASNIRNLKSDESITVCVIGAPGEIFRQKVTSSGSGMTVSGGGYGGGSSGGGGFGVQGGPNGSGVWYAVGGRDDAPENKTTMTIRVKKADCEALVKGKLSAEEFRNRAVIRIYGDSVVASEKVEPAPGSRY